MYDQHDRLGELERENRTLRERLFELERKAASFRGDAATGVKETLSEREALLVEAERIAHVGSWVWNVASHQVFWSDELFRILGYDPETDKPSVEAFFAAVHPEDLQRIREQSDATARTGKAGPAECRVRWRDGTIRYVMLNGAAMFDAQGVLQRVVGTALDITEARRARERVERAHALLAEAQRLAQVGSWTYEVATEKVEWTDEMSRILGVSPDLVPSVELFLAHVHEEDRPRLLGSRERAIRSGGEMMQTRIVRPDGTIRHAEVVATPAWNKEGELIEMRGTVLDVTRRVELEEKLSRGQKLEALGRLSGGVAHDFNNLLTVILGNLDLLRNRLSGASLVPLRQIEQAAELAANLTRQLLAFARRAHLEPEVVVLNGVIGDALNMTRRLIGQNVTVKSELAPDLWPTRVDIGQVQQILINLVVNARDAMPNGGTITVRTHNEVITKSELEGSELAPGEYVVLSIKDTGIGMEPEVRARIFEPFFTTKALGQGSGLGLAVVFGAVAQHGGSVGVDSTPNEGTTFRIYFPRTKSSPADKPNKSTPRQEQPARERVLLVEDDPSVAQIMALTLEGAGYEVNVAHAAHDALAITSHAATPFDLIITDVVMPGMRGPELVAELSRRGVKTRVLFVTGYGPELFGDAAEKREHPVLEKPFNTDSLLATVRALLDGAR